MVNYITTCNSTVPATIIWL